MGFSCSKQKDDHIDKRIETKKQEYILKS